MTTLGQGTLAALRIEEVPLLLKTISEPQPDNSVVRKEARLTNPFSIMLEIAKACYLDEVLFAKDDSTQRYEISQFIEMIGRLDANELFQHVNQHMATRMFLVGDNITAADIVIFSALAPNFSNGTISDDAKRTEFPHAFRWVDHIQHLPGMLEQVQEKNLFTTFPVEVIMGEMSKSQLKKLAKAQAAKEAKAAKNAGGDGGQQQQQKQ